MYSLKELDVDFYLDNNCTYCKKAKEMFKKEGVMGDFNLKETEPLPKNVEGVPYFFSNKTKRSQLGCPKSVTSLIEKLNGENVDKPTSNNKDNDGYISGLVISLCVVFFIFIIYLLYKK